MDINGIILKNQSDNFILIVKYAAAKNQTPKKNVAVYHIPSSRPIERFVIDAVYLSDYIANEVRYLITMIDHFSKYGRAKLVKNKSADLILLTIKNFFTFYGFPEILQSDNEKEFVNQEVENYLSKNNIKFIHGRPYHPQSQGSVEAFNKNIQNALINARITIKINLILKKYCKIF